jgi:hypothetical protein
MRFGGCWQAEEIAQALVEHMDDVADTAAAGSETRSVPRLDLAGVRAHPISCVLGLARPFCAAVCRPTHGHVHAQRTTSDSYVPPYAQARAREQHPTAMQTPTL